MWQYRGKIQSFETDGMAAHLQYLFVTKFYLDISGPFYWQRLTLILAWINNYIHCKVWDEISFPNFSGTNVEFGNG